MRRRRGNEMRRVGLYVYLGCAGERRVWDHSTQASRRGRGGEGKENPGFSLDRECVRRRRCSSLSRIISNLSARFILTSSSGPRSSLRFGVAAGFQMQSLLCSLSFAQILSLSLCLCLLCTAARDERKRDRDRE